MKKIEAGVFILIFLISSTFTIYGLWWGCKWTWSAMCKLPDKVDKAMDRAIEATRPR